MSHSTLALLVMLNNLLHDFAVALLFASLVALSVIYRRASMQGDPGSAPVVRDLARFFNRVTYACWALILAGGVIRMLAYERFEWNEAAGRGQVAALVVKHAILVALIVWGTWIQLRLRKHLRESGAG